jgi:hypothetical protein
MFSLKAVPAIATLGVTLLLAATATGAPFAAVDNVWVGGTIHRFVVTGPASAGAPTTPLYVIASIDPSHPLHALADAKTKGFGAHDHVIAGSHANGAWKTVCKLTLVLPGTRARVGTNALLRETMTQLGRRRLVYAANLGGGMKPLTSAARIQRARELGLASLAVTQSSFNCTIQPAAG